jgi:hypothetical protein
MLSPGSVKESFALSRFIERKFEMRRFSSLVLICLWGCSSGGPAPLPLYPVTGNLKVDGKPLEATAVSLMPVDATSKAKPAVGTTDKEGNFKIATNGDRGAAAGPYKVVLGGAAVEDSSTSLEKLTPAQQAAEVSKRQGDLVKNKGMPLSKKYKFPSEWADPKTSPKTFEVTTGANVLNIDI